MSDEHGPAPAGSDSAPGYSAPTTLDEARSRARLLWEVTKGSLQVIHRDFFHEETHKAIPSAALDDVFAEMQKTFQVRMKWLNAGTDIVTTDHQPVGELEMKAAQAIGRGTMFVEQYQQGQYQLAGAIRLRSQCLKCHLRGRNSTDDRSAGLPNHPMFVADDPNCADLSCPAQMFPLQNAPRSRRPAAATKRGSHAEPVRLLASDRSPQCTQTTPFLTELISVFTGESTDRGGIMACLPHASSLHTPAGSHLRVVSFAIPSFAADLPSMACEDGACQ